MAKILLVEDDNNLREIYEARLMAEGYDIVSARDGEEALTVAMKEKPDLIISDVMMPKISGFDMLDILRTTEETKNAKVIMMTALSQAEDKARAEKLGADRYLVKSQVTLEDVAKVAKEVLEGTPTPAPAASTPSTPAPIAPPAPAPNAVPPVASPAPVVTQPPQVTPVVVNDPAPTAPAPTTVPIAPAVPVPTMTPIPDTTPTTPSPAPTLTEPADTRKKVIQPINDLNENPEARLKELLEKEKEREQMAQTVHETLQKAKPQISTEPGVDAATSDTPVPPPAPPAEDKVDPNAIAL